MDEQRIDRLEDLRQLEHLLPLGFAFLLPFIDFSTILILAVLSIVYALVLSHRLIPTTRPDERELGFSMGKVSYAVSVLLLLLIFQHTIHIAAAVWGILAAGDSVSNLLGRRYPLRKLFYNPEKTVTGLVSFGIAGTLAGWILLMWNIDATHFSPFVLLFFSLLTASFCAFFESLPSPLDDNLVICWIGGTLFALLFGLEGKFYAGGGWTQAFGVNLVIAASSLRLGWLSRRGTALAFIMGLVVYASLGLPSYLALLLFLTVCSVATQAGAEEKKARQIAQSLQGGRGAVNVLSNGMIPFGLALLGFWSSQEFLQVAFLGAVVTATVDTVSTEIGQWLGKRPLHPGTLKRCAPGTPGAVSLEGTLAGLAAGLLVALTGVIAGNLPGEAALVVLSAAFISSMAESIVASFSSRDLAFEDEALNLYNTFLGAFLGGLIWLLL